MKTIKQIVDFLNGVADKHGNPDIECVIESSYGLHDILNVEDTFFNKETNRVVILKTDMPSEMVMIEKREYEDLKREKERFGKIERIVRGYDD